MFNSQKINNDPFPYVSESGTRHANPGWLNSEYFSNRRERPEYDNNPNPILERFRRYMARYPRLTLKTGAEEFLWTMNGGFTLDKWDYQEEHFDHARRVLKRLVNVYG